MLSVSIDIFILTCLGGCSSTPEVVRTVGDTLIVVQRPVQVQPPVIADSGALTRQTDSTYTRHA